MADSAVIELISARGSELLGDVRCGISGSCYQPKLHKVFVKQVGGRSCGVVSSAHVLSAYRHELPAADCSSDPPFTESNMFSFAETRSVITEDLLRNNNGMSLKDVHDLLVAHGCRQVRLIHAADSTPEQFRADCIDSLSRADSSRAIVVNYHMKTLGQGESLDFGHHSPLAAYHPSTDRLLILDTWMESESCWVTVDNLYAAMNTIDGETGKSRGYCVVHC